MELRALLYVIETPADFDTSGIPVAGVIGFIGAPAVDQPRCPVSFADHQRISLPHIQSRNRKRMIPPKQQTGHSDGKKPSLKNPACESCQGANVPGWPAVPGRGRNRPVAPAALPCHLPEV